MTNFSNALTSPQSDLAKEIVRDPYNFDFLTLREPIAERELEEGLLAHIRKFLLELGAGFASWDNRCISWWAARTSTSICCSIT